MNVSEDKWEYNWNERVSMWVASVIFAVISVAFFQGMLFFWGKEKDINLATQLAGNPYSIFGSVFGILSIACAFLAIFMLKQLHVRHVVQEELAPALPAQD